MRLVVEDDAGQRGVGLSVDVVLDEPEVSKLVREELASSRLPVIGSLVVRTRIRAWYHLACGDFKLRENRRRMAAVHPRSTAARELYRSKRGNRHELERPHPVRRANHCAPDARSMRRAS